MVDVPAVHVSARQRVVVVARAEVHARATEVRRSTRGGKNARGTTCRGARRHVHVVCDPRAAGATRSVVKHALSRQPVTVIVVAFCDALVEVCGAQVHGVVCRSVVRVVAVAVAAVPPQRWPRVGGDVCCSAHSLAASLFLNVGIFLGPEWQPFCVRGVYVPYGSSVYVTPATVTGAMSGHNA